MNISNFLASLPGPLRVLFDHNRWTTLSALVGLFFSGCAFLGEPKTESPVTNKPVTQQQLATEADTWAISFKSRQDALLAEAAQMEIKFKSAWDDLDIKRQKQANLANFLTDVAAKNVPGPFGPIAVGLIGLLTAGLAVDNRRKDAILANRTPQPEAPALVALEESSLTPTQRKAAARAAAGARKP